MDNQQVRLTLVTPRRFDPAAFAPVLDSALSAVDVDAVILDVDPADEEAIRSAAAALVPVTRRAGAALLLHERDDLVRELNADGAHVSRSDRIDAAKRALKPDFIVGAGDCTTRHSAMMAGERTPDYVFLGRLDREEDRTAGTNLVSWWAELFELPCVAMAADEAEDVHRLASAGADFIALRDLVWNAADGPAAALERLAGSISMMREPAE